FMPEHNYNHTTHLVTMGVDFAMGKQRGDYSAVGVIAHDKEKGISDVIEAYGERISPDEFIDKIIDFVIKYEPDVIAAEATAAQEFFVDTLKQELMNRGYPAYTRVKKIYNRTRKELRIETMLPDIENSAMRLSRKQHLLIEQSERYGQGAHDDVIDAVEMAKSATKSRETVIRTVKRLRRWKDILKRKEADKLVDYNLMQAETMAALLCAPFQQTIGEKTFRRIQAQLESYDYYEGKQHKGPSSNTLVKASELEKPAGADYNPTRYATNYFK